jgi:ABC-type sugar transport system ATPase subunit
MEKILQIKNLYKKFNNLEVLKGINLDIYIGEVVTIIGSSGSGKSTLLRCINQLEEIDEGEIIYKDININNINTNINEIRQKIGMVFQSFNLFENMNVLKNCTISQIKVLKRNKIIRLIAYVSTGIVVLVSLFVSIWYMKDDKNFLLTDPVKQNVFMFLDVLPFVVLSLVWGIACVFVSDITAKQDISILKNEKLFVLDKKLKVLVDDKTDKIIVNVARVAIGVTAITFIVLGVLNGGMRDVFIKAINICTECIGLG